MQLHKPTGRPIAAAHRIADRIIAPYPACTWTVRPGRAVHIILVPPQHNAVDVRQLRRTAPHSACALTPPPPAPPLPRHRVPHRRPHARHRRRRHPDDSPQHRAHPLPIPAFARTPPAPTRQSATTVKVRRRPRESEAARQRAAEDLGVAVDYAGRVRHGASSGTGTSGM